MKNLRNLITIAGEGQNVGKTMFACALLNKFGRNNSIAALKISPHRHHRVDGATLIQQTETFSLFEEKNYQSSKDTGRMLASGAEKAFLLLTEDDGLMAGFESFLTQIGHNQFIICESGRLSEFIKPGVSFLVRQLNCKVCNDEKKQNEIQADFLITYTTNSFDFNLEQLEIIENNWVIKN